MRLVLMIPIVLAGRGALPPPIPENNIEACRGLARIERDLSGSMTDQVNAKRESHAIGCPRIL